MELLINKAIVSGILQVAIGYNEAEFDVFIKEAQYFDLKPLLCEEFYYELIRKKSDNGDFQKILEGGKYTYNDNVYGFRGLNDVLSYFTYGRFILKCNYVSTSHGVVTKETPHSIPLNLTERRNMYNKYREDANIIFEDLKKYVERNKAKYESWFKCQEKCGNVKRKSRFKTRVLK